MTNWQQTSNCRWVNEIMQQKAMNWLRLLKKHDRFVTIKWCKQNLIFVTINWYKQNLMMLLVLWLKHVWIDMMNWKTKAMKKQKDILHDKCQVDFLNNRYLNSQEQKRMFHNTQSISFWFCRYRYRRNYSIIWCQLIANFSNEYCWYSRKILISSLNENMFF